MDLRDLKALARIAESGSLSGAASRLNLTQPALSALIRRLEEELDVQILNRHSRGVTFTEPGLFLLDKARNVLNEVDETVSALQQQTEEPVGTVRIGLPASLAGGLIPTFLPMMAARYEKVRVHIVEGMSGNLAELLRLGKLDIAVLFDVQPDLPGLQSEPVLTEEMFLLRRRGDIDPAKTTVALAEAAQSRLVLPSLEHTIRQFIERAAQAEGIRLEVAADVDSLAGLVNLVKVGYATILPAFMVRDEIRSGAITPLRIQPFTLQWSVHLVTIRESVRARSTLVAGRLLIDACRDLVLAGDWPGKIHPRHSM